MRQAKRSIMLESPLKIVGTAAGLGAVATAMAALGNGHLSRRTPALRQAIEAEQGTYGWDGGRVEYARAGTGPPMLLLHSHNAAASSYEMRQVFQALSEGYQVFAPDLPGYGRSERRAREYFAHTYIRFLHDFVSDVIGEAAIVIAASVSAAHALLACDEDAHAFSHLILASPTGLSAESASAPPAMSRLSRVTRIPVWGQAAYNALVSRRSIRWHYENLVYHNPWAVTHEMVDYAWATAHQPNARFAPGSFLSGALWADARAAYAEVRRPTMVVWGDSDRLNPYSRVADFLPVNPGAVVRVIPNCGGAPYDERVTEFANAVRAFLLETGAPPESR